MGTFSGGYMLDPATGRPVVGRTVAVTSWPDEVPLTPDDGALATGPDGGYGIFSVAGRDVVQLRAGDVEQVLVSVEKQLEDVDGGTDLLEPVSGAVTLPDAKPVGTLVGYRVTSSATFTGQGGSVTLGAGAHVFERVTGGWEYRTLDEGTPLDPPVPDTTPPNAGTLTVTGVTDTSATLTVSGASDNQALHAAPYRFSTNAGSTWTAYQAGATHTPTLTPETTYQPRVMVRDAAGNTATATAADFTTEAAPPLVADWAAYDSAVLALSPVHFLTLSTDGTNQGSAGDFTPTDVTFGQAIGTTMGAEFNGTSSLMTGPAGPVRSGDNTSCTIEAVVLPTSTSGGWRDIAGQAIQTQLLAIQSNRAAGHLGNTAGNYATGTTPFGTVLRHVAFTYDGAHIRVYLDGVLDATVARPGTIGATGAAFSIGRSGAGFFAGRITRVAAYASTLTPGQILDHAQKAGLAP